MEITIEVYKALEGLYVNQIVSNNSILIKMKNQYLIITP